MQKTYQLIEPDCFVDLLGRPGDWSIALAVLTFVVRRLKDTEPELCEYVELEIVKVTHLGSYPAIGAFYKRKDIDLESRIQTAIGTLLESTTAMELVQHLTDFTNNWRNFSEDHMINCSKRIVG